MSRFAVIDGLRGYAMLGVIYSHTFYKILTPHGAGMSLWLGIPFFPAAFLSNAWMGVSLFFILSGFVLAYPYAAGVRTMQSAQDAVSFYRRRAWRLYPVYWSVMIPIMLLRKTWDSAGHFLYDAAFVLTGLGAFHPRLWMPSYYAIVWTLEVEIMFSVFFPLLLVLMRRYGSGRVLLVSVMLNLFVRSYGLLVTPLFPVEYWMNGILGGMDDFLAGMAIALAYASGFRTRRPAAVFFVGVLTVFVSFSLKDAVATGMVDQAVRAATEPVFTAGMSLIIIGLLCADRLWARLLFANRPLRLIGMMCFSVYLHHYWLIKVINPTENVLRLGVYIISLLAISFCTYRFIEFPKKAWKDILPSVVTPRSVS